MFFMSSYSPQMYLVSPIPPGSSFCKGKSPPKGHETECKISSQASRELHIASVLKEGRNYIFVSGTSRSLQIDAVGKRTLSWWKRFRYIASLTRYLILALRSPLLSQYFHDDCEVDPSPRAYGTSRGKSKFFMGR